MNSYEQYCPEKYRYVVGVDVGVKHLGLSFIALHENYNINDVIWIDLIDITEFIHMDDESTEKCALYHDKTFTDYLEHLFYLHAELFAAAEYVLIERQPPQGYVVVEQLIFSKFRNKAVLISPNSMHKFFGWTTQKLDYDRRKEKSVRCARRYITRNYVLEMFDSFADRQHDVADSICILVFWCHTMHCNWKYQERSKIINEKIERLKAAGIPFHFMCLDKYKYIPML